MARIILLDDEPRLLKTVRRFLEHEGHEVTAAGRLEEVSDRLYPERFDILLSDIFMPVRSGIDVLRQVTKRGCSEPVVLITGQPNLETASDAVRNGAFDYVTKPLTKDKLLDVVSRATRHIELVRERDRAKRNEMELLRNFATIGESAAILAHEIKTPLSNLNMALRAVADKLEVEHGKILQELVDRLQRMQNLMQRTLSFAKPIEPALESCNPKDLLEDVCAQFRGPHHKTFHTDLHVEHAPDEIAVDRQLLEEVLVNLVQNAAEACEHDGEVRLSCRQNGSGTVHIEVEDDGPGIPADRRGDLFKLFHTTKETGTGMGLTFCRKVIEAHGGRMELVDGDMGGACFRIELQTHLDGGTKP
ncbi:MAG: sensor histidine kinase [Planctomycetota bacterium]|jgi:signal transduction histidine kinase